MDYGSFQILKYFFFYLLNNLHTYVTSTVINVYVTLNFLVFVHDFSQTMDTQTCLLVGYSYQTDTTGFYISKFYDILFQAITEFYVISSFLRILGFHISYFCFFQANPEHYVFSTFGVLHVFPDRPAESQSLSEWQREAVLWKAVSSIPFFKNFLVRKLFYRSVG